MAKEKKTVKNLKITKTIEPDVKLSFDEFRKNIHNEINKKYNYKKE